MKFRHHIDKSVHDDPFKKRQHNIEKEFGNLKTETESMSER